MWPNLLNLQDEKIADNTLIILRLIVFGVSFVD